MWRWSIERTHAVLHIKHDGNGAGGQINYTTKIYTKPDQKAFRWRISTSEKQRTFAVLASEYGTRPISGAPGVSGPRIIANAYCRGISESVQPVQLSATACAAVAVVGAVHTPPDGGLATRTENEDEPASEADEHVDSTHSQTYRRHCYLEP